MIEDRQTSIAAGRLLAQASQLERQSRQAVLPAEKLRLLGQSLILRGRAFVLQAELDA